MSITLQVTPAQHPSLANDLCAVYVNAGVFANVFALTSKLVFVRIKGFVLRVKPSALIEEQQVFLNYATRLATSAAFLSEVVLTVVSKDALQPLTSCVLEVGYFKGSEKTKHTLDCNQVAEYFKQYFLKCCFNRNQVFGFRLQTPDDLQLRAVVQHVEVAAVSSETSTCCTTEPSFGVLLPDTQFKFVKPVHSTLNLHNTNQSRSNDMFVAKELSFDAMGIGGLQDQFVQIFRRAFASRLFPPDYMQRLGLQHVKGILMHGPPGCGKTLIARELSKALKVRICLLI